MINAVKFETTDINTMMKKIKRINFDENNDSHDVIGEGKGRQIWSEWKDIERNSLLFGYIFDDFILKLFL